MVSNSKSIMMSKISSKVVPITCEFNGCYKSFATIRNKQRHAQTHNTKKFRCTFCNNFRGSRRPNNLHKHHVSFHPEIFDVLLEIPPDVQDYFKQALVFQTHPGSTAAISQTFRDGSQASMLSRTSSETAELATFRDVLDVEFPFQPQVAATSNTLQWQNVADGVHIAMAHSNVSFDQASGGDGGEMQFGLWSSEWYKATRVLDGKIQCI